MFKSRGFYRIFTFIIKTLNLEFQVSKKKINKKINSITEADAQSSQSKVQIKKSQIEIIA